MECVEKVSVFGDAVVLVLELVLRNIGGGCHCCGSRRVAYRGIHVVVELLSCAFCACLFCCPARPL